MRRLLAWYPPAWRSRYGEELVALLEDELGDRRPPALMAASLRWAGLRERLHGSGLTGDDRPASDRMRAASLLVLGAWAVCVVAGASFSKASEHFARALPAGSRALPQAAFDAVVALGVAGGCLVLLGASMAIPAFIRFVSRAQGWPVVRGRLLWAGLLSALTVVAVVPLSMWAHHLDGFQRNGGEGWYSGVFVLWSLMAATSLALWTAAAVSVVRRLDLTRRVLRAEALLAVALQVVMVGVATAVGLWWAAMASSAPWFVAVRAAAGTHPSPVDPQLVLTLGLMTLSSIVASYGVVRIAGAARALRAERLGP